MPIVPVHEFLVYLNNLERSPNTIRAYAHHLKCFWEFVAQLRIDWTRVGLAQVADFVAWLRRGTAPDSKSKSSTQRVRSEATVNVILAAVSAFYEYQERLGVTGASPMSHASAGARRPYKAFLHRVKQEQAGQVPLA